MKLIVAFFTQENIPKTGLSPTLDILDIEADTLVVSGQAMESTALNGFYKYEFTSYNAYKNYAILCDGGILLDNSDRYQYGVNNFVSLDEMSDGLDDADGSLG